MQPTKLFTLGAICAFVLAACAQPEPEPISVEPIYNKYGAASCSGANSMLSEDGYGRQSCVSSCSAGQTATSSIDGQLRCVPTNGCRPGTGSVAGGPQNECIPIDRGDDNPQNPRDPNGRSPTGGPNVP
jgi:hypothetical protein